MMVRLYPITFRREQLGDVPNDYLLFHLLLAQITNDIIAFRKQALAAMAGVGNCDLQRYAGASVAHLNIQMSAGRLLEGHLFLNNLRFKPVRDVIHPVMYEEGLLAFKEINRYFGKDNRIYKIRNRSAFHVDLALAEEAMLALQPDLDLTDYISDHQANSFYGSGAALAAYQMALLAGPNDDGLAFERLLDDVSDISNLFEKYTSAFMLAFAEHFLSADPDELETNEISLEAPDIRSIRLPYFMDAEGVTEEDLTEAFRRTS